jgi:hypothetical protein
MFKLPGSNFASAECGGGVSADETVAALWTSRERMRLDDRSQKLAANPPSSLFSSVGSLR